MRRCVLALMLVLTACSGGDQGEDLPPKTLRGPTPYMNPQVEVPKRSQRVLVNSQNYPKWDRDLVAFWYQPNPITTCIGGKLIPDQANGVLTFKDSLIELVPETLQEQRRDYRNIPVTLCPEG